MQFFKRGNRWLTREQVKEFNQTKKMPSQAHVEPVQGLVGRQAPEQVGTQEKNPEDMGWGEIKNYAKEKGMDITNSTKKDQIIEFLNHNT